MLRNTFIHLPGIGPITECSIWQAGLTTWDRFLDAARLPSRIRSRESELRRLVEESRSQLEKGRAVFFEDSLPGSERWRLYGDFRRRAAFLDIETTGLSPLYSDITMVGIYDVDGYTAFVQDENLDDLREAVEKYDLIVTYNGAAFDVPFIEYKYGRIFRHTAHMDLRFPLRRLGHKGGLKRIEARLGLSRPSALSGLDGFDAVLLWQMWRNGDAGARDTLVSYNAEDVASLPKLAEIVYDRMTSVCDAPCERLEPWIQKPLDLPYDEDAVARVKSMRGVRHSRW